MKATNILILGRGEMGRAMLHLLGPYHNISQWYRRAPVGTRLPRLGEAGRGQSLIIFAVPTEALYELASTLRPSLEDGALCLAISKGLDNEGRPAYAALEAALGPTHHAGVIYGPMIAEDLVIDRAGFAEVGLAGRADFEHVNAAFAYSPLYLTHNTDALGLSWCAVLKNIYAIAFGAADGLGLGDNVRGFLAATAIKEMSAIITGHGGRAETPYGFAGLGDLVTTATSIGSHHHALGLDLAYGKTPLIAGEGVHSLKLIRKKALVDIDSLPLMRHVENILNSPDKMVRLWQDYLFAHGSPAGGKSKP